MEKLNIVKVKDYDNEGGMLPDEIDKLLAEKKLRPPTEAEWMGMPKKEIEKYSAYTPVYLGRRKDGLLSRGDDYGDGGRCVGAYDRPSGRYGVLGIPIGKQAKHKHVFVCECGARRR